MSGDLRALLGAGRLQRTLAMRVLRVASVGVLSLVALLLWVAAEPTAPRADHANGASALSSALPHDVATVTAAEQRLTSRKSARSARVAGRNQLLVRSRTTDGDGDTTVTSALAPSAAEPFGDAEESARVRLRRLALGHAPYGEPSPFDATAPPSSSPRNG